jgi:hypothetical protein
MEGCLEDVLAHPQFSRDDMGMSLTPLLSQGAITKTSVVKEDVGMFPDLYGAYQHHPPPKKKEKEKRIFQICLLFLLFLYMFEDDPHKEFHYS